MTADLMQIVLALLGAGAVYGGIRSDLRAMHESIRAAAASANAAHRRLDEHLDKGRNRNG